jgi:hypothetical protein
VYVPSDYLLADARFPGDKDRCVRRSDTLNALQKRARKRVLEEEGARTNCGNLAAWQLEKRHGITLGAMASSRTTLEAYVQ